MSERFSSDEELARIEHPERLLDRVRHTVSN